MWSLNFLYISKHLTLNEKMGVGITLANHYIQGKNNDRYRLVEYYTYNS